MYCIQYQKSPTRNVSLITHPERYDYIGRFLKPGEEPNEYSDEEDHSQHEAKLEALPSEGDKSKDE